MSVGISNFSVQDILDELGRPTLSDTDGLFEYRWVDPYGLNPTYCPSVSNLRTPPYETDKWRGYTGLDLDAQDHFILYYSDDVPPEIYPTLIGSIYPGNICRSVRTSLGLAYGFFLVGNSLFYSGTFNNNLPCLYKYSINLNPFYLGNYLGTIQTPYLYSHLVDASGVYVGARNNSHTVDLFYINNNTYQSITSFNLPHSLFRVYSNIIFKNSLSQIWLVYGKTGEYYLSRLSISGDIISETNLTSILNYYTSQSGNPISLVGFFQASDGLRALLLEQMTIPPLSVSNYLVSAVMSSDFNNIYFNSSRVVHDFPFLKFGTGYKVRKVYQRALP